MCVTRPVLGFSSELLSKAGALHTYSSLGYWVSSEPLRCWQEVYKLMRYQSVFVFIYFMDKISGYDQRQGFVFDISHCGYEISALVHWPSRCCFSGSGLVVLSYLETYVTPILIAAEQHHGTTASLRGLTWNIGACCSNYHLKKLIIALFSPSVPAVMMKDWRVLWCWLNCRFADWFLLELSKIRHNLRVFWHESYTLVSSHALCHSRGLGQFPGHFGSHLQDALQVWAKFASSAHVRGIGELPF